MIRERELEADLAVADDLFNNSSIGGRESCSSLRCTWTSLLARGC